MLDERVAIYTSKGSDGGKKTTIVVDNMTEKTRQAIIAALYGLGNTVSTHEVSGYEYDAPSKNEASAMEAVATDVSGMEEYQVSKSNEKKSPVKEETPVDCANRYWIANYKGNRIAFLQSVTSDINAAKLNPTAGYMMIAKTINDSQNDLEIKNLIYYSMALPIFREGLKQFAEQKGFLYIGDEDSIKNAIGNMNSEDAKYMASAIAQSK